MSEKANAPFVMKGIEVQDLPLTERKAEVTLVIYGKESLSKE